MVDIPTYHVDTSRSGLNPGFAFAPVGGTWRRYAEFALGNPVRAAPLYLAQYTFTAGPLSGQTHDVVIVAASDNKVYAFSESQLLGGSTSWLWTQQTLGPPSPRTGSNIPVPVGICGTPIVDRPNAVIYVMAYVHGASSDAYTLFALDLNTGDIVDQALISDAGAAGRPTFDPTAQDQRGGLNLVNGWIFATFADFLAYDAGTYYGWVVGCNQQNLTQQLFFPTTLKGTMGGGAWGPGGAAAAPDGSLYVNTGNGVSPSYLPGNQPKPGDYFEGVVHLGVKAGPSLQLLDVYQPTWAKDLNDADLDFGGSSPIVLPPIGGQEFIVTTAKDGNAYLLGSTLPGFGGELWTTHNTGGLFGAESKTAPAYFHDPVGGKDYVYVAGSGNPGLAAFTVDAVNKQLVPAWNAGLSFGDGPGAPFVTQDPTSNKALVWVVDDVLRAFDAVSGTLVFHSDAVAGNDIGEPLPHFAPVVGAGKSVFIGTNSSVVAYTNVPPTMSLIVIQSTFGQNEVELGLPGVSKFPSAGYVELDGFRPSDIGNLSNPTPVPTSAVALDPTLPPAVTAAINGMNITAAFTAPVLPLDASLPDAPQGFLFPFAVSFANDGGFLAMRTANITSTKLTLTASIKVSGVPFTASGQLELTTGEDPRFVDIDPKHPTDFPSWLSFDLRFFKVVVPPGQTVNQYGGSLADASGAAAFIATAIGNFTNADFDGLHQDEDTTKIEFHQHDNQGNLVFNFGVARVRLIGKNAGTAQQVRVFFRLFNAQTTNSSFNPATTYKTFSDGVPFGHNIPLMGIEDGEYRTIPCFATPRINLTDHTKSMQDQFDGPNARNLATIAGGETDYFFGCWLDVNQPLQRFLPSTVPATNPFSGPWTGPFQSIQEAIVSAPHQCLIAEINFDETPIPPGANSGTSDKLAQRNIAWIDGPNPGIEASRAMPHPIQVRATQPNAKNPDELLILWGNTPKGSTAQLYLPSLDANAIVQLANRHYADHGLSVIDARTVGFTSGSASLVPLPAGSGAAAGLLTIGLPPSVRKGDAYRIIVRQLSDARAASLPPPPPPPQLAARARGQARAKAAAVAGAVAEKFFWWRRASGAFQFNLVISTKQRLLLSEERLLATLKWMQLQMPAGRSWYPVLGRYIEQIAGRVQGFGGHPGQIPPSPTGDVPHRHHPEPEERDRTSGKVAGLIFDRFGDFEGFILETGEHRRTFLSREREIRDLVEWAWRERLRLEVWSEEEHPRRPVSIVVCHPPVSATHRDHD
jgi:hypothetical protein